jgi:hypothetical protein
MATDRKRRDFLRAAALLGTASILSDETFPAYRREPNPNRADAGGEWPALLASWEEDAIYRVGLWTPGYEHAALSLPDRLHGLLPDPLHAHQAIGVARRPGAYILRFDVVEARAVAWEKIPPDRVLNGHAVFSTDGKTLYTSESTSDGNGVIGVRDARTLRKIREFSSNGIEPHELCVDADGSLLIANGGVLTLAATGRIAVDPTRIDSSLVRSDPMRGQLIRKWRLADPHLSIRHLARTDDGIVGIALQAHHERADERNRAPLFACLDRESLRLGDAPRDIELRDYGGDVTPLLTNGKSAFAVSCTRAGLVGSWDPAGCWLGAWTIDRPCALTSWKGEMLAASDTGEVCRFATIRVRPLETMQTSLRFDNHMTTYA